MSKKIAILLGEVLNKMTCNVKRVKCNENRQKTTKFIKYLFLILLLALHLTPYTLHLTRFDGVAYALVISTNTANMQWTDGRSNYYAPVSDTAAVWILNPPVLLIAKDVYNLRSGETSADVVSAVRGDTVEFMMSLTNTGDTEARDVVILDSIPFGTIYDTGSALDTSSYDTSNLAPDTITFQHIAGGAFDTSDTGTITAIKWQWDKIDGVYGYNKRVVKFRVKVQ